MNIADLYLKLFLMVVLPLAAGMCFSKAGWAGRVSSFLFGLALYLFQNAISFLAVWNAQLVNNSWALPLITLAAWLVSLGMAFAAQPFFRHTPKERGAFVFTICLSNHGYTLLGIIAFMAFGDIGLAQATYAQLLIFPFLVLVCFPIARHLGEPKPGRTPGQMARENIIDKRNLPLVAMLAGLALNLMGVERPAALSGVVTAGVYAGTVISGLAVGLIFNAGRVLKYKKENLFSFIYRSTLYPLFFLAAARLLRLDTLNTFILVLFGLVPSAIFSNLIADFFKLDKHLANSVYIVSTTIFLVLVLPLYLFVVGTVSLLG